MNQSVAPAIFHSSQYGCVQLARLRLLVGLFEQQLRRESLHNEATVRHWRGCLSLLDEAVAPLEQLLDFDPCADSSRDAVSLTAYRREVASAVACLFDAEADPLDAIYAALAAVVKAGSALARWQEGLAAAAAEHGGVPRLSVEELPAFAFPGPGETERHLRVAQRQLRSAIQQGDSLTCRLLSRQLFLATYFTAVVQPRLWTRSLHGTVVAAHEEAIRYVDAGYPHEHALKRLDQLRTLNPAEFSRRALIVAGLSSVRGRG